MASAPKWWAFEWALKTGGVRLKGKFSCNFSLAFGFSLPDLTNYLPLYLPFFPPIYFIMIRCGFHFIYLAWGSWIYGPMFFISGKLFTINSLNVISFPRPHSSSSEILIVCIRFPHSNLCISYGVIFPIVFFAFWLYSESCLWIYILPHWFFLQQYLRKKVNIWRFIKLSIVFLFFPGFHL